MEDVTIIVASAGLTITWNLIGNAREVAMSMQNEYGEASDVWSFDTADGIVVQS